jgi:hypothetical protein
MLTSTAEEGSVAKSRVLRPGAVRFRGTDGQWVEVVPGSPWFSTATMLATEYLGTDEVWRPVWDDVDEFGTLDESGDRVVDDRAGEDRAPESDGAATVRR